MNAASVTVSDSPTPCNLLEEFEEAYQDIVEMRGEIARKDELLKKLNMKLTEWKNHLESLQTHLGSLPPQGPRQIVPPSSGVPQVMGSPSNIPVSGMSQVGGTSPGMGHGMPVPHMSPGVSIGMGQQPPMMGQVVSGVPPVSVTHMGAMGQAGYSSTPVSMGNPVGGSINPGTPQMGGGSSSIPSGGGIGGHMYPTGAAGHPGSLQGHLAYLEKTTSNIGLSESRR